MMGSISLHVSSSGYHRTHGHRCIMCFVTAHDHWQVSELPWGLDKGSELLLPLFASRYEQRAFLTPPVSVLSLEKCPWEWSAHKPSCNTALVTGITQELHVCKFGLSLYSVVKHFSASKQFHPGVLNNSTQSRRLGMQPENRYFG